MPTKCLNGQVTIQDLFFTPAHLKAMLRDLVLTRMGRYNDEATVAEAMKRFEEHYKGEKTLPADLRGPVSIVHTCGMFAENNF
jgi:hypothetical protein